MTPSTLKSRLILSIVAIIFVGFFLLNLSSNKNIDKVRESTKDEIVALMAKCDSLENSQKSLNSIILEQKAEIAKLRDQYLVLKTKLEYTQEHDNKVIPVSNDVSTKDNTDESNELQLIYDKQYAEILQIIVFAIIGIALFITILAIIFYIMIKVNKNRNAAKYIHNISPTKNIIPYVQ